MLPARLVETLARCEHSAASNARIWSSSPTVTNTKFVPPSSTLVSPATFVPRAISTRPRPTSRKPPACFRDSECRCSMTRRLPRSSEAATFPHAPASHARIRPRHAALVLVRRRHRLPAQAVVQFLPPCGRWGTPRGVTCRSLSDDRAVISREPTVSPSSWMKL